MANKDIFNYLFTINFNNNYEYKLPIYYILGENDWQTPYTIASEYFQKIDAPNKKLYLIKNAGHMTMVDNKDDFLKALLDIEKI
ncbi:MAG: alpha/beta fold hydrolase [Sarcina sp.]